MTHPPVMQTLGYKGHYIHVSTQGNHSTVRIVYGRPDCSSKPGPPMYTVHGAKLWITRLINRQHQQALLMNALHDIKHGRPNVYAGATRAERETIHHAFIQHAILDRPRGTQ